MKRLQTTLMLLFIVTAVAFTSCDTEDGMDGAQGEQGIAGQDGQDGQDGNANVIFSDWIPTEFSSNPDSLSTFDVVDPQITEDLVNTAAILAYGGIAGSNAIIVIPYTFFNESYYFAFLEGSNSIRFVGASVDGSPEVFDQIDAVRYVIIPPVEGSGRTTSNPESIVQHLRDQGVDINNYEEVAAYYNLN